MSISSSSLWITPTVAMAYMPRWERTSRGWGSAMAARKVPGAMEWKGFSSAVATAIPMISKTIPTRMITSKIRNATAMVLFSMSTSDSNEMEPEMKMVTKKMVITHFAALMRSFFKDAGSDFATVTDLL